METEISRNTFSENRLLLGVFILCAVWALATARVGWYSHLSDSHGFRQTQTALTTYYLLQGGPLLPYETPVLGPPWSVPFEFPLYQWLVAGLALLFRTALAPTGRFVNELFFVSSLVILWSILAEAGVKRAHRLVFLTLVLVSPLYVFWSRTFMIESTVVFFCMAYLLFVLRYIRSHAMKDGALAALCGTLGILVKVTTFPGFALVGGVVHMIEAYREARRRSSANLLGHILPLLLFALLPLIAVSLWTSYADQVKAQNVMGMQFTSSATMDFTFGFFSDRISIDNWKTYLSTAIPNIFGNRLIVLVPLVAFWFVPKRRLHVCICTVAFLVPFLIFTPLHVQHDYYAYANGIFLIAALAWCIIGLLEGRQLSRLFGVGAFFLCVLAAMHGYYGGYYRAQSSGHSSLPELGAVLQRVTQPQEVVIGIGLGWTSEVPYYSRRRALMWPRADFLRLDEALAGLADRPVGALVACLDTRQNTALLQKLAHRFELARDPEFEDPMCAVYTASERQ